jgi:hypothetical protein
MGEVAVYKSPALVAIQDSQLIQDCTKQQLEAEVQVLISKALLYLGKTLPLEDKQMYREMIVRALFNDFPMMRLNEIGLAVNMGIKGNLNTEYRNVSPVAFGEWMKLYKVSDARRLAMQKYKKMEAEVKKLPPQEIGEDIIKNRVEELFQDFKNTGDFDDYGQLAYTHLKKLELIVHPKKQTELFNRAKREYYETQKRRRENAKSNNDIAKFRDTKTIIKSFLSAYKNDSLEANQIEAIKRSAKKILVKEQFEKRKNQKTFFI